MPFLWNLQGCIVVYLSRCWTVALVRQLVYNTTALVPCQQLFLRIFFLILLPLFFLSLRYFFASLSGVSLSDEFDSITDFKNCQHPISKFFQEILQFSSAPKKALILGFFRLLLDSLDAIFLRIPSK